MRNKLCWAEHISKILSIRCTIIGHFTPEKEQSEESAQNIYLKQDLMQSLGTQEINRKGIGEHKLCLCDETGNCWSQEGKRLEVEMGRGRKKGRWRSTIEAQTTVAH